ncbi:MAG TPA: MmgE/PrpD family protein [Desulfobacteraceae bacterium]|nr:MmgE/PrpD family protein [Desulfobacteraceae bacterium]
MNSQTQEPVTIGLSQFIRRIRKDDIPLSAMDAAQNCTLDLIASALAGHSSPAARAARKFAAGFFPEGHCTVWFSGSRLSPSAASMVNAVAASALDLDDGNRLAGGHPGAAVIPAALAWSEFLQKAGDDFLTAVIIGYEAAVRIAAARDLSSLDTFSTGRWCGFGAAAAAGWLKNLPEEIMAHALAISGIHAPIQSASAYSRLGHNTKEGIPWGTLTGLSAVELAENGFTGPLDLLDHPDYYNPEEILKDLGDSWAIERTYFKRYSCCRWAHAAIDALVEIMGTEALCAEEIQAVEVHTFRRAIGLKNQADPATLEAAQFSVPFCMAVAAFHGLEALLPMDPEYLRMEYLSRWAKQVHLVLDEEMEALFPEKAAARVVVKTHSAQFEYRVDHPKGDLLNPFTFQELQNKFRHVAKRRVPDAYDEKILSAIHSLKSISARSFAGCLGEIQV